MQSVSIIGAGRIGGALAIALSKCGYRIENLVFRSGFDLEKIGNAIEPPPQMLLFDSVAQISSDIVFISSGDPEIEGIAQKLASKLDNRPTVFHTSGSLSSSILVSLQQIGCQIGSIHPLISISDPVRGAGSFAGIFFCIEGDIEAVKIAEKIAKDLGGKSFSIETQYKSLYHAAAVTACGHLVALVDASIEMLSKCGLEADEARHVLLPLIKSTVENLDEQTAAEALTGSFARADVSAVKRHIDAIGRNVSDEVMDIYLLLGERSLKLAAERGAAQAGLEKIREELSIAKRKSK